MANTLGPFVLLCYEAGALTRRCGGSQFEKEFPELLPIKESLRKYVFEPNAAKQPEVLAAVKAMRGR